MQHKKNLAFELMRIVAAFFVIFNHTGEDGFLLYAGYPDNSLQYWLYACVTVFCKMAVPLFFAVSGALLLGKRGESLATVYRKVGRIAMVLVLWSLFYYSYDMYVSQQIVSPDTFFIEFLKKLYTQELNGVFWYLYAYIGYLMTLPILREIASSLSTKTFLYLFGLALFCFAILPMTEYLLWQDNYNINSKILPSWLNYNFARTGQIFVCPLLGYFLNEKTKNFWNLKRILLLNLANVFAVIFSIYMIHFKSLVYEMTVPTLDLFYSNFDLLGATTVFVTIQYVIKNRKQTAGKPLLKRLEQLTYSMGACSFGIYLMHSFVIGQTLDRLLFPLRNSLHLNPMIAVLLYCGIVLAICYIVTLLLRHLPLLRKLV